MNFGRDGPVPSGKSESVLSGTVPCALVGYGDAPLGHRLVHKFDWDRISAQL